MKQEIAVTEIYKSAWDVFKKAPLQLMAVIFVSICITLAINILSLFITEDTLTVRIFTLFSMVVNGILALGLIDIVFQVIKTGEVNISKLFDKTDLLPKYIVTAILYALIVLFGLFIFIIPGIIFLFKFSLYPYILVDNDNISPLDALKRSWNLLKGHIFDLLLFYVFTFIILGLSLMTCGLGLIISIPLITIAYGLFYIELEKDYYRDVESTQEPDIEFIENNS